MIKHNKRARLCFNTLTCNETQTYNINNKTTANSLTPYLTVHSLIVNLDPLHVDDDYAFEVKEVVTKSCCVGNSFPSKRSYF